MADAATLDPSGVRQLFGGAIEAEFPLRFQDISNIREVPDHQEVYADPGRDESIIIEILEYKDEVSDAESARWFLADLATEQDAGPTSGVESTSSLRPEDVPGVNRSIVTSMSTAVGLLTVAKSREGPEARNLVRCHLGSLRLPALGTDVLITVYEPLMISQHSQSASVVGPGAAVPAEVALCQPAMRVFRHLLATLRVLDTGLFGSA